MDYDVMIKSHPKDYHKLNLVIDSLSFLSPQPKNIYIVSPDGFKPDNEKYGHMIKTVKDSEVFPNIDRERFKYRKNWQWQNCVSILQDFTENDLYLDVQADNFFTKEIELFDSSGKPRIFRSIANGSNDWGHPPYFIFNKIIFNLDRWDGKHSYIIEFMLYDKKILKDFFLNMSGNKTVEDLLEKFYKYINKKCYLADQELYGNIIEKIYSNEYCFIDNTPIKLYGSHNEISYEELKAGYEEIRTLYPELIAFSFHTWRDE